MLKNKLNAAFQTKMRHFLCHKVTFFDHWQEELGGWRINDDDVVYQKLILNVDISHLTDYKMNRKILIINGNPEPAKNKLNEFVSDLTTELQKNGEEVKLVNLQNMEIKQCLGCFDCWLKTPGICRFKDDVEEILKETIMADLLLFTSPLIMGMYSALLKRFQDRMIPIIHPYLEMVNNECHHRKRYARYPKLGFIFDENDASPEEIENVRFIHQRMVLNMHSELQLFDSIQQSNPKELGYELISL